MRIVSSCVTPALAVMITTAAACQTSGPRVAAARRVAAAYVSADTAGHWQAADSLVNWRSCDFDPATDYLQLTTAARVSNAVVRGDTVDVTVEYEVLGRAWSYDRKRAGETNWRFTADRRTDKLVLHVLPTARPPIACGEYQPNHVSLSQMSKEIAHMDDSSRTALEQAKRPPR